MENKGTLIRRGKVNEIKYLLWNIYKKNLCMPIKDLVVENKIDILALIETDGLDKEYLIEELYKIGQEWINVKIEPKAHICLLIKKGININVIREEKHYCCYKVYQNNTVFLLFVVHLSSAMYKDESARSRRAISISRIFQKIEEEIFGKNEFMSMVIGDFNLQPYSTGIIGIDGFNATMSSSIVKKISRVVDGEERYYYFNPIWKLMGENQLIQGTYFSDSDQEDKSIFWYSFDEVLIRPYFVNKFLWNSFKIIEKTIKYKFISNCNIDKKNYSDHLPIKFEIE